MDAWTDVCMYVLYTNYRGTLADFGDKPAMAPKPFYIFFEKNPKGQHKHFIKIFSVSKFNLAFPRTLQIVLYVCVHTGLYLKNML